MRIEKLTDNFRESLADAQSKAISKDNQFIEPLHLMLALLEQKGTVYNVLQKSRINTQKLQTNLNKAIDNLPKVEGTPGEIHISNNFLKLDS